MRILVIGAGAIGGYVGAKLALAGHAVTFVGRQPLADAVTARGLRLIEPGGESVIHNCQAVTSPLAAFAQVERFHLALFTVKTYDTRTAIDELRPFARAKRVDRFLSLQNGVSSEDLLGEAFGREKVVGGTILNPVSIPEPGVVVLEKRKGGMGLSWVSANGATNPAERPLRSASGICEGASSQRISELAAVESLAEQMRRASFQVRIYADYRAMKWSKLLLNLIGNASSAILDMNTLQVFADKRLFTIEIAALREAMRVGRAQGIRFVGLPGYPLPLLVAAVRFLPMPLLQRVMIPLVAKGRGRKMPSLHIDLHSGKRRSLHSLRSEIDELNGAVVRAGARLNIPTPANVLFVETYNDLQVGRADPAEWREQAERLWALYSRIASDATSSARLRGGTYMDATGYITAADNVTIPWLITEEKVQAAVERIVAAGHPRAVILFGSYARSQVQPSSDLDMLVVVDNSIVNCRAESVRLRRALRGISMPVDIVIVRHADLDRLRNTPGLLYETALKEGRLVYERR